MNDVKNKLDFRTSNFVILIGVAINWIMHCSRTKMENHSGEIVLIKLLSDKFKELCIPHKVLVLNKKCCCGRPIFMLLVDDLIYIDTDGVDFQAQFHKDAFSEQQHNELESEYEKVLSGNCEKTMFDVDCIPQITKLINEAFCDTNIGDFQPEALHYPELIETTQKTRQLGKELLLEKLEKVPIPEEFKKLMRMKIEKGLDIDDLM